MPQGKLFHSPLGAKRVGHAARTLAPVNTFAFLANPNNPVTETDTRDVEAVAASVGHKSRLMLATENEIESAFAILVQEQAGALLVDVDAFFYSRRKQLVDLSARHAVARDVL